MRTGAEIRSFPSVISPPNVPKSISVLPTNYTMRMLMLMLGMLMLMLMLGMHIYWCWRVLSLNSGQTR